VYNTLQIYSFSYFVLYDRDFVSVRQIAAQDGCYYSASQATTTTLKPEQPGKVRYVLGIIFKDVQTQYHFSMSYS
jgi:hypothetical protein